MKTTVFPYDVQMTIVSQDGRQGQIINFTLLCILVTNVYEMKQITEAMNFTENFNPICKASNRST